MVEDLSLDDIVELRKPHPCGSFNWKIVRLGADIKIRCIACERQVMLSRSELKKRRRNVEPNPSVDKVSHQCKIQH